MHSFWQFVLVTVLGLTVTWLAHKWIGLFDNLFVACGLGFGLLCAYAFIYDRMPAILPQDKPDQPKDGRAS